MNIKTRKALQDRLDAATTTSWNIAAAKRIKDWDNLVIVLKAMAADFAPAALELVGACAVPGPGCLNIGLMLDGAEEHAEAFVGQVTMAFMPAKYGRADGDPMLVRGAYTDHTEDRDD